VVGEAADHPGLDRAAFAGEPLRDAVAVSELGLARSWCTETAAPPGREARIELTANAAL
jgi:hypothetical protein